MKNIKIIAIALNVCGIAWGGGGFITTVLLAAFGFFYPLAMLSWFAVLVSSTINMLAIKNEN